MLREYGRIAPNFVHAHIKEYILDLKRNPTIYENLVLLDGEILLKMSMSYPPIFKECLEQGLGAHTNVVDIINWALFCGPTAPSVLNSMTNELRVIAINYILDHKEKLIFFGYNTEYLDILLYFPTNPSLTRKFLDKIPQIEITNEWLMAFLHRGNPNNIPTIVSHKNHRHLIYQQPNFITKMLPSLRSQLAEDESFLGPADTVSVYYDKLADMQKLLDNARQIARKENWNFVFWISIFIIRCRNFLQRYYEPLKGKGYMKQALLWEQHKESSQSTT